MELKQSLVSMNREIHIRQNDNPLSLSQTTLDSSKQKEFADDNSYLMKIGENSSNV